MVLNQATYYAMKISLFLAKQDNNHVVEASAIYTSESIPKRFFFKIIGDLTKSGIVKSIRGRNGGFILGRKAEDINFYNIIEAMEGPITLSPCLLNFSKCNNTTEYCIMHKKLEDSRNELIHNFESINLKFLIENKNLSS